MFGSEVVDSAFGPLVFSHGWSDCVEVDSLPDDLRGLSATALGEDRR